MRLPNLVIAGPPKCGTTSMFHWLSAHPEVWAYGGKETYYFMDADHPLLNPSANYHRHGLSQYASFVAGCSPTIPVLMEVATHYIYQETALKVLATAAPLPHVVFILRKPSQQIFSNFSFAQNSQAFLDPCVSFEQFVSLLLADQLSDIRDLYGSESCFWIHNQLLAYGRYCDYFQRWANFFPLENLHIYLFEDLTQHPTQILTEIAQTMGIDPSFYQNFQPEEKNQTVLVKNSRLHQALTKISPFLPMGTVRTQLKSLYFRFNTQPPPQPTANALAQLDAYFEVYNRRLAQDYGLNLSAWH